MAETRFKYRVRGARGAVYETTTLAEARKIAGANGTIEEINQGSKGNWLQDATESMEDRGTVGSFSEQARDAGYADTLDFAGAVMAGWHAGGKRVYNRRTGRYQGITEKTMRRAVFALNAQKRRNPERHSPFPASSARHNPAPASSTPRDIGRWLRQLPENETFHAGEEKRVRRVDKGHWVINGIRYELAEAVVMLTGE